MNILYRNTMKRNGRNKIIKEKGQELLNKNIILCINRYELLSEQNEEDEHEIYNENYHDKTREMLRKIKE